MVSGVSVEVHFLIFPESARNDIHVTKINATGPIETNAHLLKYDSTHGRFHGEITVENDTS